MLKFYGNTNRFMKGVKDVRVQEAMAMYLIEALSTEDYRKLQSDFYKLKDENADKCPSFIEYIFNTVTVNYVGTDREKEEEKEMVEREMVEKIAAEVGRMLPDKMVCVKEVTKANQPTLGILIKNRNQDIGSILYPATYGKEIIKEIATKVVADYEKTIEPAPILNFISEYSVIKNRLYCQVMNTERNTEYLRGVVSEPFLDLSVVPMISVDSLSHVAVTEQMLHVWGIDAKDVIKAAKKNGRIMFPEEIRSISSILGYAEPVEHEQSPMTVITNNNAIYGAAFICDKEVINKATHGEDAYILPSSIHDIIVVPANGSGVNEDGLREMVKSINRSVLEPEDFLSDNIYWYDSATKTVSICM